MFRARVVSTLTSVVLALGIDVNLAAAQALSSDLSAQHWMTNGQVLAVARFDGITYIGGTFTQVKSDFSGGTTLARQNLAAFDDATGMPTAWDPGANGTVRTLALRTAGPNIYAVFAGGDFTTAGGQSRARLAALDPITGVASSWNPGADSTVRCFAIVDSTLFLGGAFSFVSGLARPRVAAVGTESGAVHPIAVSMAGEVHALARISNVLVLGGSFLAVNGENRSNLAAVDASSGVNFAWNPGTNGLVRAVVPQFSAVYVGGDFTNAGGASRSRLAALSANFSVAAGSATAWNPNPNFAVRALALGGAGMIIGGDFDVIGGFTRASLASFTLSGAGELDPWIPSVGGQVHALAVDGPLVTVGGIFNALSSVGLKSNFAVVGALPTPDCPTVPSFNAGSTPRDLAALDVDLDGVLDLVVCNASPPAITVMRGQESSGSGNGTFIADQELSLPSSPKDVTVADFDLDGRDDVAVSHSDVLGAISLFHNLPGGLVPWSSLALPGRSDGITTADFDLDGILDVLVCLTDSALTPNRGGVQIVRGGGTGGVWDGSFVLGPRFPAPLASIARRALVHDFNQDAIPDIALAGGATLAAILRFEAAMDPACYENALSGASPAASRYAITSGDFNEDGRTDLALVSNRAILIRLKNAVVDPDCGGGGWFTTGATPQTPSTPRDLEAIDWDQDGILDLVCSLDSTGGVGWLRGHGEGNVGDGTFGAYAPIVDYDAWGLAIGDFVTNGESDLAITSSPCGVVTVLENGTFPVHPVGLTVLAPNGGEFWPAALTPPFEPPTLASWLPTSDGELSPAPVEASSSPGRSPLIASTQLIEWEKGPGMHGVDIAVSRDGGTSWRTIASNMPGESMPWIVTPPATSNAIVRVRDAAYPARSDGSNAPFTIQDGVVGIDPIDGTSGRAELRLLGRQPFESTLRMMLDMPQACPVVVALYDVAGRRVRSLVQGSYPAGTHMFQWDGLDEAGRTGGRGIYFVRARVGSVETTIKVVRID